MSNTSYYLYQKYEQRGSQEPIPVYPNVWSVDGEGTMPKVKKMDNDPNCGYVPPAEPIYRWTNIDISTDYICDDCNSYYSGQYLTFVATESGTFKFSGTSGNNSVSYSLDSGSTWNSLASNTDSPTVNAGNKIMWKATLTPSSSSPYGISRFSSTGNFTVEGNVMSLLYGDNFSGQTDLTGKDYAFSFLFSGCTGMTSAENLSLPATTLVYGCYNSMFDSCTSLTTAPVLPATTLAVSCYEYMFKNCTSLTIAPSLPATTLANYCYDNMFRNCTSLTTAPVLPATTLAIHCYRYMFRGCTSLTTAPELPATTLANYCYEYMFYGCTSLTTAPELPATTLAQYCYEYMFQGCTSLTTAPVLSATTLAYRCYRYMFSDCTRLTTAPVLSATTLTTGCYEYMFYGCSSLNSITCLATDISASNCTYGWVNGVASSGTFTKAASMSSWTSGVNGIPSNWTIQNV